jgi:rhodanese-related sulfurtransferase
MHIIDRESLKRSLDKGTEFTIINVLPEKDYDKEHIRESINIPFNDRDFEKQVEQTVGSKETPIVVYCYNSTCPASKNAAEKLEEAGFTHVLAYEGGIKEWKDADYPVEGSA